VDTCSFLTPPEVFISTKFVEDQENLFPRENLDADQEFYDSVSSGMSDFSTLKKILTVVKDMDESSDSIEKDYTPYIDAPLSTYPDAIFYTTHIEPALLATLEPLDLDFFFTLTILHVPTLDDDSLVSPLIVLFTTNEESLNVIRGKVEELWTQRDFDRYLVSMSLGHNATSAADKVPFAYDLTGAYHENWKCGVSIGWSTKMATSGAILKNGDGEYYAITCAHLFNPQENNCVGFKVTQPSFEDFKAFYKASVRHRRNCEKEWKLATDHESRKVWEVKFRDAETIVRNLDAIKHDTREQYQTENESARVVQSSYKVVDFEGRRCLLDYALLRLESRFPSSIDRIEDLLPRGYLGELDWENDPSTVGRLRYDIRVKKRGRATGATYGIIAGVYGVYKSRRELARREFWALPEALSTSLYEFAEHGDSGSLVWTNDGEAVGIVISGWTVAFDRPQLHAAILRNGYWDTKNIPFFRDEEGNIDFTGLLTHVVSRPLCLIESLEMVLEDMGDGYELWVR
jgi:hypothetical protein